MEYEITSVVFGWNVWIISEVIDPNNSSHYSESVLRNCDFKTLKKLVYMNPYRVYSEKMIKYFLQFEDCYLEDLYEEIEWTKNELEIIVKCTGDEMCKLSFVKKFPIEFISDVESDEQLDAMLSIICGFADDDMILIAKLAAENKNISDEKYYELLEEFDLPSTPRS